MGHLGELSDAFCGFVYTELLHLQGTGYDVSVKAAGTLIVFFDGAVQFFADADVVIGEGGETIEEGFGEVADFECALAELLLFPDVIDDRNDSEEAGCGAEQDSVFYGEAKDVRVFLFDEGVDALDGDEHEGVVHGVGAVAVVAVAEGADVAFDSLGEFLYVVFALGFGIGVDVVEVVGGGGFGVDDDDSTFGETDFDVRALG